MIASVPLRSRAYLRLREEVLEYLWRRFPHHCMVMTDPQTRKAIDLAAARAAAHGFVEMHEVCSWVTLTIWFGSYFDDDPLCDWAARALRSSKGQPREQAMRQLFSDMNEATNPISGDSGEHYRSALLRVLAQRFAGIAADIEGSVDDAVIRWVRAVYPQKYASLTSAQVAVLLSESHARAQEFQLAQRTGSIVSALLIVLLGTGNDRDPLYPWIGEALRAEPLPDPLAKTSNLYAVGTATLRRYLLLDRLNRRD